jgi:hypothetical protein
MQEEICRHSVVLTKIPNIQTKRRWTKQKGDSFNRVGDWCKTGPLRLKEMKTKQERLSYATGVFWWTMMVRYGMPNCFLLCSLNKHHYIYINSEIPFDQLKPFCMKC